MQHFDERAVELPIIEDCSNDGDLIKSMEMALASNATSCSILVKGHGLFVFGKTWQEAKEE